MKEIRILSRGMQLNLMSLTIFDTNHLSSLATQYPLFDFWDAGTVWIVAKPPRTMNYHNKSVISKWSPFQWFVFQKDKHFWLDHDCNKCLINLKATNDWRHHRKKRLLVFIFPTLIPAARWIEFFLKMHLY